MLGIARLDATHRETKGSAVQIPPGLHNLHIGLCCTLGDGAESVSSSLRLDVLTPAQRLTEYSPPRGQHGRTT